MLTNGQKLKDEIIRIADIIASTMGPGGKPVLLSRGDAFGSTKDGVTVARWIAQGNHQSPEARAAAMMVVDACQATVAKVGDGTTQTAVLVRELAKVVTHENIKAFEAYADELEKFVNECKLPVKTVEDAIAIASVSCNGDVMGTDIGQMCFKAGEYGQLSLSNSTNGQDRVEMVDGYHVDGVGMAHIDFATYTNGIGEYQGCNLILWNEDLNHNKDLDYLVKVLDGLSPEDWTDPFVIMGSSIIGPPLQMAVANSAKYRRPLKLVFIKAPEFGTLRMGMMDDIAYFTGAKIIDSQRGNRPDSFTADHIGRVDHIVASMKSYTFFMPEDQAKLASERVDELRFALATETDQDNIARLEKRIALLTAGIGVFHVGGLTEQEQTYRKDLAEDAIKATLSAIKHGYVKGGGSVMWEFSQKVKPEHMDVFMAPSHEIAENLAIHTHEFLDGLSGIFDPSKVSVESYRNALSVIKTSLDSKYMLHD